MASTTDSSDVSSPKDADNAGVTNKEPKEKSDDDDDDDVDAVVVIVPQTTNEKTSQPQQTTPTDASAVDIAATETETHASTKEKDHPSVWKGIKDITGMISKVFKPRAESSSSEGEEGEKGGEKPQPETTTTTADTNTTTTAETATADTTIADTRTADITATTANTTTATTADTTATTADIPTTPAETEITTTADTTTSDTTTANTTSANTTTAEAERAAKTQQQTDKTTPALATATATTESKPVLDYTARHKAARAFALGSTRSTAPYAYEVKTDAPLNSKAAPAKTMRLPTTLKNLKLPALAITRPSLEHQAAKARLPVPTLQPPKPLHKPLRKSLPTKSPLLKTASKPSASKPASSKKAPAKSERAKPPRRKKVKLHRNPVLRAASIVTASLRNGPWPSPYLSLEFSDESSEAVVTDTYYTQHSQYMAIISASIEQFSRDVVMRQMAAKERSEGARSDGALEASNAFLGTLLILREVLTQNGPEIFGPIATLIGVRSFPDAQEAEQSAILSYQVLATSIILAGIESMEDSNPKQLVMDFLNMVDKYDGASDEIAACMAPLDHTTVAVLSNGEGMRPDERLAWQLSTNLHRDAHPVIKKRRLETQRMDSDSNTTDMPMMLDLAKPNACHVSILEEHISAASKKS